MPPLEAAIPYKVGNVYNRRRDIHDRFGGQRQGGISTPPGSPFVFLFTGGSGEQYGYSDGWSTDGIFSYTGEGQIGPMEFVRGNRAIRDHSANGQDLLLFEKLRDRSGYRFLGTFGCAGYEFRDAPDREGRPRRVIVFQLVPLADEDPKVSTDAAGTTQDRTLPELRRRALAACNDVSIVGIREARRSYYERSAAVRAYVLARADGRCEACTELAPFRRPNGELYLEPHHTRRVSDGGPDHPRWVAALCPTCHRRVHYGGDGSSINDRIIRLLGEIEGAGGYVSSAVREVT